MNTVIIIIFVVLLLVMAIVIQYQEIKERDDARNDADNFLYFVTYCAVNDRNDKIISDRLKELRASPFMEDNVYCNTVDTISSLYTNKFYLNKDRSW